MTDKTKLTMADIRPAGDKIRPDVSLKITPYIDAWLKYLDSVNCQERLKSVKPITLMDKPMCLRDILRK